MTQPPKRDRQDAPGGQPGGQRERESPDESRDELGDNSDRGSEIGRRAAVEIANELIAAGHIAYLAGGSVRDRLRGESPHDHDIATDATPARVREIFPRAHGVGESFGVMLVRRHGRSVEVATFRSDGTYADGRRPDSIRFGGPREDALRRDFTINGLFEDPRTGEVVDFVDGQRDIVEGVIRCIGDPALRLAEDQLRALRAVRFAARFEYRIEPATEAAIAESAATLTGVSRERIGQELRRMLAHPTRSRAVELIERLGLDTPIFGEAVAPSVRRRLAGLPAAAEFVEALVAWMLDREEGAERLSNDASTELALAKRWSAWCRAIVCSNAERADGASILEALTGIAMWPTIGVARRKRCAASPGFGGAMTILTGVAPAAAEQLQRDVASLAESGLAPAPLLSGDDLIDALGLTPGPGFRLVLERLYDAQLEGQVRDRGEAIELAHRLAAVHVRGRSKPMDGGTPPRGEADDAAE